MRGKKQEDLIQTVQLVLQTNKEARDNKLLLYAECVKLIKGLSNQQLKDITFYDIYLDADKYKLPKYDSIVRFRNMIQRDNVELRGETYRWGKEMEQDVTSQFVERK